MIPIYRSIYLYINISFYRYIFILLLLLFLTALGLRCYVWASSRGSERGLLFIVVRGLLIAVASLVAEHGLQACGLSSCGTRAQ